MAEYSEIYYDKKKENPFHHNEDKLCNRLVVCAFAVCFLWATSLQLCTEIVGYYIPSPTFSSVYESCKYDATEIQRAVYRDCVNRQLDVCDESLVQSNQKILMTVDRNHKINSKLLQNFEQLVDNSSESLLSAKNALNAWLTLGIDYKIYYSNNASNAEITRAKQIIGDTSKETVSIFASTEEYARDSDSTIVKLAQYSSDLNNYNVQYVHNKTKNLQFKSLSIIDKVSKPQLSFFNNSLAQIDQAMDQLMACIGLQDPTTNNQKCLQSQTLKGLYDNSKMAVNSRIDRLKVEYQNIREIFDDFAAKTEIVVRNALDFYDSIAGKAGIIIWIAKNTNVNAITGSLCGKSSPNWCDFKPVSLFNLFVLIKLIIRRIYWVG